MNKPNKTVHVIGNKAGTDTLVGTLYWMTNMTMLEYDTIVQRGNGAYAKILDVMRGELCIHTPKHCVTIKGGKSSPDGIVLLLAPGQTFDAALKDELGELAGLFARGKAVILVDLLKGKSGCLEEEFNKTVTSTKAALQDLGISAESVYAIPVLVSRTDNLTQASHNFPWCDQPLIDMLDIILRPDAP